MNVFGSIVILSSLVSLAMSDCDTQCNINGTKTCEEGICTCKSNVIGADCSSCKHEAVDLDPQNEAGCAQCYCTDRSPTCMLQTWAISHVEEAFEATRGEGWHVQSTKNSSSTSRDLVRSFGGSSQYLSYDGHVSQLRASNFYWVLPRRHGGNWVNSYGSEMKYTLNLRCGSDFSCSFNQEPWVVVRGGILGHYQTIHFYIFESGEVRWRGLVEITIPIHEGYTPRTCWRTPDLKCIKRSTLINVLSNVVEVKIKAGIFRTSYSMAIGGFKREVAAHAGTTPRRVEVCSCPAPYTGTSCEECRAGMWHKHGWGCERCECNGYSYNCHSFTGECRDCPYDTACHNCDCCAEGFYGKPRGDPNPCTPCPCNGRAAGCTTQDDGSFGICVGCEEGYEGVQCERCRDGYYGNPAEGIPCQKCLCSGNIDTSVSGNCHNFTGECYNCLHRTTGEQCHRCVRGYYGDATQQQCQQCRCDLIGAKDNICNTTTGNCTCKENVRGTTCNECAHSTYGLSSGRGCIPCSCDTTGTVLAASECDWRSGQCNCQPDRQYKRCNGCVNGYHLRDQQCLKCHCPPSRSANYSCDGSTGQCYCKQKYTGDRCDTAACLRGPWSDWTLCDVACGNGTQTRTRQVHAPDKVVVEEEGLPVEECEAVESEQRACNTWLCDVSTECQAVTVLEPLSVGNCRTRRHYPVKKCRGTCTHADIDCCQPYLLTHKKYRLYCTDGSKIYLTFDDVQQCGCLSC